MILQTNTGVANTGIAQALNPSGDDNDNSDSRNRPCSAATLAGRYGFVAQGAAGAPVLPGTSFGPLVGEPSF